jgi:hypothetical protein
VDSYLGSPFWLRHRTRATAAETQLIGGLQLPLRRQGRCIERSAQGVVDTWQPGMVCSRDARQRTASELPIPGGSGSHRCLGQPATVHCCNKDSAATALAVDPALLLPLPPTIPLPPFSKRPSPYGGSQLFCAFVKYASGGSTGVQIAASLLLGRLRLLEAVSPLSRYRCSANAEGLQILRPSCWPYLPADGQTRQAASGADVPCVLAAGVGLCVE